MPGLRLPHDKISSARSLALWRPTAGSFDQHEEGWEGRHWPSVLGGEPLPRIHHGSTSCRGDKLGAPLPALSPSKNDRMSCRLPPHPASASLSSSAAQPDGLLRACAKQTLTTDRYSFLAKKITVDTTQRSLCTDACLPACLPAGMHLGMAQRSLLDLRCSHQLSTVIHFASFAFKSAAPIRIGFKGLVVSTERGRIGNGIPPPSAGSKCVCCFRPRRIRLLQFLGVLGKMLHSNTLRG